VWLTGAASTSARINPRDDVGPATADLRVALIGREPRIAREQVLLRLAAFASAGGQSVVVSVACAAALTGSDWPVADASPTRVMQGWSAMTNYGYALENPEA
jgi:hypothetical protein